MTKRPTALLIVCRLIVISLRRLTLMTRVQLLRALGATVRQRRESQGLSQEQLADRAGVHRTYLGSVERGERNVAAVNLYRIACALGWKLGDLFTAMEADLGDIDV
jgi:DNA-binding XRE family transcriptional regulator